MSYWPDIQYVTGLSLGARFAVERRMVSRINNGLKRIELKWPNKPVDFLGSKEVEDDVRSQHLYVEHEEEEGQTLLSFELVFFQDLGTTIPRRGGRQNKRDSDAIDATLDLLKVASKEVHVHCRQLTWRFPPGEYDPLITLPLMKFNLPDFPFEDVTGLRFNSSSEQRSAIIDRTRDGSLVVTAAFAYHTFIDKGLVERTLEFATNLIRPLIIERQDEDNDGS